MEWTQWSGGTTARLIIAATLLIPSRGLAQTVDIGGHVGFYNPVGSLIAGPPIEKRLQSAVMGGMDAVVWTSGRLGFAGRVTYASNLVAVIQPGSVTDRDATVILAVARVVFAVTRLAGAAGGANAPWSVFVGAGAGLASRRGAVWSYASGRTSPALVLNLGVQTFTGPRSVLRLDVENYISRAHFNAGAPSATLARMHQDLAVSLALFYRFHRR
jgi:hypothetical protein